MCKYKLVQPFVFNCKNNILIVCTKTLQAICKRRLFVYGELYRCLFV
ncbi:hypothetical protein HanIR_Chr02g0056491 [Helianthus annuus]|nr:hypothetical protein HanIR_Chr02g0056491 [Helianthus annuus]